MKSTNKLLSKIAMASMALALGFQLTATSAEALVLHKVQKGDNLYRIGQKYGLTVENIIFNNDLSSDHLRLGQVLKIHSAVKVKKGDTLYSISKEYGQTVDGIKRLNNLQSNVIKVGQTLKLYDLKNGNINVVVDKDGRYAVVGYDGVGNEEDSLTPPQVITVHSGDTLKKIAKDYDTTVPKLKSLNKLKSDSIKIGQKLKVRTDSEQKAVEKKVTDDFRKELQDLKKNDPDEYKLYVQDFKEWKNADPSGFNDFLNEMPLYAPVIKELLKS